MRERDMRSAILIGALLASATTPPASGAQTVTGTIVDRGTAAPLPGTVVLLLDSLGGTRSRGMTDQGGVFRVTAPGPGSYRLRTLRLGFVPGASERFQLHAGQTYRHDLAVASIPFSLDTVRVVADNSCRLRGDSAAVTYAVWDQARTVLNLIRLSENQSAVTMRVLAYNQTTSPDALSRTSHNATLQESATLRPWLSAPIEQLSRAGYTRTDPDGSTTFFAPDIDVLLSDEFLDEHCFRIASRTDDEVSLHFEPKPSRRSLAEVEGEVVLHRATAGLRRLVLRYVNIPSELRAHAKAEMEFARMRNDRWFISRWKIRMPLLEKKIDQLRTNNRTMVNERIIVNALAVRGAELVLTLSGSDTLWRGASQTLKAHVIDSVTGVPVRNARVRISGIGREGLSNADGLVSIPQMLPGEYEALIAPDHKRGDTVAKKVRVAFVDSNTHILWRLSSDRRTTDATGLETSSDTVSRRGKLVPDLPADGQPVRGRDLVFGSVWVRPTSRDTARSAVEVEVSASSFRGHSLDWGLYSGRCDTASNPVPLVPTNSLPFLNVDGRGKGVATMRLSLLLSPQAAYHVAVFAPPTADGGGRRLACANLDGVEN